MERGSQGVTRPVVVDVGCATHGSADSIGYLIDRFHPSVVYGFDPNAQEGTSVVDGVTVVQHTRAAWVEDGEAFWHSEGNRSRVVVGSSASSTWKVRTFDLAAWIRGSEADDLVVKLDVEGVEFDLITDMIARRVTERVGLLLVEWHPVGVGWERERDHLLDQLAEHGCAVEECPL